MKVQANYHHDGFHTSYSVTVTVTNAGGRVQMKRVPLQDLQQLINDLTKIRDTFVKRAQS